MPLVPVILSTFAQSPSHQYLTALQAELDQIRVVLEPATQNGALQLITQADSRNESISQLLAQHLNQVFIFHFGGHADADMLLAADGSVFVEGLADQLALQPNLKLVFLNGCNTQPQGQHFFRQDIPVVLATTCSIADGEASYFAAQFYRAIAERHNIAEAFQLAVGALKSKFEQYRGFKVPETKVLRGLHLGEQKWPEVPWQLYVQEGQENALDWFLPYPRGLTTLPSLQIETDCLGREKELDELRALLESSSKVVLVSGLGGMGKTTLAAGYLQWLRNDYDHIAWINSASDIISAFALNTDLASNLELPVIEGEKLHDRFLRVMNKLRNQPGRNLLVIDDAGDQLQEIASLLPGGANWQILVTSRLAFPDFREMNLGVLQPADAMRLFRLYFQDGTNEEVQELLSEINYHTLTIEVMAKTLNRLNGLLTVPELIVILKERKLDDPRLQELVYTRHAGEERAIFFHLMKAFELAKLSEEEVWLMQQYAVLPASPIEVKTLAELVNHEPLSLNAQVNLLNDKGWINKQGKGLGMHRMVQEVVKYQRAPSPENLSELLDILASKMAQNSATNAVKDNFPWFPYAEKTADYFSKLEIFPENVSMLWNNLAFVYQDMGSYSRAIHLMERALASDLKQFDPTHHRVALSQGNLANLLNGVGERPRAAQLLEAALASELLNFAPDDPQVIIRKSSLALVLRDIGEYPRAKQLLEEALESEIRNSGSDHPTVAIRKSNLSTVFSILGDYPQAAQLQQEAFDIAERHFAPDHPKLSTIRSNLALAYKELGDYSRAAQLLEASLASDIRNFGNHHFQVAIKQSNLATVLTDLKEYNRAAELLEAALASSLQNFGPDHPNIGSFQSNLALVYKDLGDYPKAASYLEQALTAGLKSLGAKHPSVALRKMNLASVYLLTNELSKAKSLLKQAEEAILEVLGKEHQYYEKIKFWEKALAEKNAENKEE